MDMVSDERHSNVMEDKKESSPSRDDQSGCFSAEQTVSIFVLARLAVIFDKPRSHVRSISLSLTLTLSPAKR